MTIIVSPIPTPQTMSTAEPLSSLPADGPPGSQGESCLQQPPKAKAVEGEDVVFPCFLKSVVDEVLAVEKVSWYVQSLEGRKNVLQGNETVENEFAGRVILSGDLSEGDLSMTVVNLTHLFPFQFFLIFFALHLPQFLVNYIKGELHMGHYITHIPLVL